MFPLVQLGAERHVVRGKSHYTESEPRMLAHRLQGSHVLLNLRRLAIPSSEFATTVFGTTVGDIMYGHGPEDMHTEVATAVDPPYTDFESTFELREIRYNK